MLLTLLPRWLRTRAASFLPLVVLALALSPRTVHAQTLQTLSIYGSDAAMGTIDPNTDCSKDGQVTWLPAYSINRTHPWGNMAGTTSWISRNLTGESAAGVTDANPEILDFRIRFYAPAGLTSQKLTFSLNPDNYGDIFLNGTQLNSAQIVGPTVAVYTVTSGITAGLNTIIVRLKDTGGWLGINYAIQLEGYATSGFQRLVAPPAISNVSSTAANAAYKAGAIIPVQVKFNRAVTVTGTPRLTLETGASDRNATYASGSGTDTLTFNYTVLATDASNDLEYLSTGALALSGGTIKAAAADLQDANLTLPATGNVGSLAYNNTIVIDTIAPMITAYARQSPSTQTTNLTSVTYRVTATEPLLGLDGADFITYDNVGNVTGTPQTVTQVAGTNFYDVEVVNITGNGNLFLNPAAVRTVTDMAGNPIANSGYSASAFTFDHTVPSVAISTSAPNLTNATIPVSITFSESVSGLLASEIAVTNGTASGLTGGGTNWSVTIIPASPGTVTISIPANAASDNVGNGNTASNVLTRTFDNVAPDTAIATNPPALSNSQSATFTFTSTDSPALFETKLDGAAFASDASPKTYTTLSDGAHTFQVRAKDALGNVDATPATYTWTIDTIAPRIASITRHNPSVSPTNADALTFRVTFNEPVTGVNAADFTVSGTTAVAGVAALTTTVYDVMIASGNLATLNGTVTLGFVATPSITDLAGNALTNLTPVGANVATYDVVNNAAPTAIALSAASINQSAATAGTTIGTLTTSDPDTGDTFTYSLVTGTGSTNNASFTLSGGTLKLGTGTLGAGSYSVRVRTTDAGGLFFEQAFAITVVDDIAPDTSIASGPAALSNSASATLAFNATESGSTFEASLDGGAFTTVTSPRTLSGLADGAHTFAVRAKDPAGNLDTTPATYAWTSDTTAPVLVLPTSPVHVNATSTAGAAATFTVSATDALDGAITPTVSKISGSTFATGNTTVTVSATDAAGNLATGSFVVTVHYISLTEDKIAVTIPQGGTATNAGTFSEATGEAVTLTASVGTLTQTTSSQWTYQNKIEFTGNPIELSLDSQENLYVVDQAKLYKYDSTGALIKSVAVAGTPKGVAVDTARNIVYTIANGSSVVRYDLNLNVLSSFGSFGNGDGQLNNAYCVAVDGSGNIFVTDTGNARIVVFNPSGQFLRKWGSGGSGAGQFNFNQGIRVASNGNVYVADRNNHRVQYFTSTGTYLGQWGTGGSANGQFNQPAGVGIDPSGNVYVGDLFNHRVQKFTATGVYLDQFSGSGDGALSQPHGTCFPPAGRSIYIASWGNKKIVKYLTPGAWSWTYTPPANAIGTSTVTVDAASASGATASIDFTLTITDATKPVLALPVNIIAEATSAAGAAVTFTATATDNVDGSLPVTLGKVSGSTFPLGVTSVSASATDASGNVQTGSFTISVVDTTAPVISAPSGNVVATATSAAGAAVAFSATATDLVSGNVAVTASSVSGSVFSLGTTPVTLSTIDAAGNPATTTFNVIVNPAVATITLTTPAYTYDGTAKSATATTSPAGLSVTFTYDGGSSSAPVNAGPHTVTASISLPWISGSSTGSFSITPASLDIAATPVSKIYGSSDPALAFVITNGALAQGDAFVGSLVRLASENVGSYAIGQGTLTAGSNYTLGFSGATLAILPKPASVTAAAATKVYGSADPVFTGTLAGFLVADNVTATYSRTAGENVADGPYAISAALVANPALTNYAITTATAALAITPAPLAVAANAQSKVYGSADPALTYSTTGLQFADAAGSVLTGALTRVAGETVLGSPYAIQRGTLAANSNYTFSYTGADLAITPATATFAVNGYTGVYDGQPHGATGTATGVASTDLASLLNLGASFTNVPGGTANWSFHDPAGNYLDASGSVAITLTKADATIAVTPYTVIYDGNAHVASGMAKGVSGETLAGLSLAGTTHTNAGTFSDTWTFTDTTGNYNAATGAVTNTIGKAAATIAVTPYNVIYDGAAHTATGTVKGVKGETLAGLSLTGTTHTNAGSYTDTWTFADAAGNYVSTSGSVTDVITQASATIALAPLTQMYDGTPRTVVAVTTPADLTVTITYNGSTTAPTLPGSYAVVATIVAPNYEGTQSGTLTVGVTALVRHGLTINGDIDGSVQVLLPENSTFNGNSGITGDLLVPGTPTVQLNGRPTFGGTKDGTGVATPTNYNVTLNGNALLRYLVRRTNAVTMATVAAPALPSGTRGVNLNKSTDPIGAWATLKDLTLNGNVGNVTVPAGVYGSFNANGGSGFTLGVAGASTPSVYQFQSLTLNGNTTLNIVGPVIIVLKNDLNVNGNVGSSAHPEWLDLRISSGSLTLNGNVTFKGYVTVPSGTVTINGNSTLTGGLAADRLVVNGNGVLIEP